MIHVHHERIRDLLLIRFYYIRSVHFDDRPAPRCVLVLVKVIKCKARQEYLNNVIR